MRITFYSLILCVLCSLENCKPDESEPPKYTFKAQIIDATTNKVPVGLTVTLQASSSPDLFTKFRKETLGTAVTDSMGRFSITYKRTNLPILDLLSQFLIYNNLPINKNIDTVFYRSSKGTLVFVLTANNPLGNRDTLYLGLPPLETGQGAAIIKLPGPFASKEVIKFKTLKGNGGIQYFWAIGRTQWDSATFFSYKYPQNKFDILMRGDPYIDTLKIKYR